MVSTFFPRENHVAASESRQTASVVSGVGVSSAGGAHTSRDARATVTLRRGRTKRGFWIAITTDDPALVDVVERAVLGAGAVEADVGAQVGGAPVRWSYEWADLVVREEADGAYHVYRRRGGHASGSDGVHLEELLVTTSREHALLEMGALLEAGNRVTRVSRTAWSPRRSSHEASAKRAASQKAA